MSSAAVPSAKSLNILGGLATALQATEANAVAALVQFFGGALLEWSGDEAKIVGDAVVVMIASLQAGKSWEDALTDGYNTFSAEESAEGKKIAVEVLNAIASIAKMAESIL